MVKHTPPFCEIGTERVNRISVLRKIAKREMTMFESLFNKNGRMLNGSNFSKKDSIAGVFL